MYCKDTIWLILGQNNTQATFMTKEKYITLHYKNELFLYNSTHAHTHTRLAFNTQNIHKNEGDRHKSN